MRWVTLRPPKPIPKPSAPIQRLPERKAVTIIAGFRCLEGIVICGDTQETVPNLSKRHVAKVKIFPSDGSLAQSELGMAICGSGEGPFIDLLARKVWDSAQAATSREEATLQAETAIKETYREYGNIYQSGQCPQVELIYGIKVQGESSLFHAFGPVVNEVDYYKGAGAGYYMADFLQSRVQPNLLTLHQCVLLSAYILFQAKEHVDGCGGESHIAVLRHEGESGLIDSRRVQSWTSILDGADRQLSNFLIECASLSSEFDVQEVLKSAIKMIAHLRNKAREEIRESDRMWDYFFGAPPFGAPGLSPAEMQPRDDLGFIKPSSPRRSEGLP
jgi:20S proteasome alpha/beta subunit